MNNELIAHYVFMYAINFMFIILNLLIMIKTSIVKHRLTSYPWVPVNSMGMSFGKILNPLRVRLF